MTLRPVGIQLTADGSAAFLRAVKDGDIAIAGFGKSATEASGKVSGFGQIATGALRQVGAIATNALADAGRAMVGFLGDSIKKAGDFESGMNEFAAVTGSALGQSGKSLKDFSDLFIQLGRDLPVSTKDVEQAAIELAKGGIDPATIAAGALKTSLSLAAAGGLGLADSANIMSKQLGVWVDTAASAADKSAFLKQTADLLSQAANVTTSDVSDMALGLANVGGVAKLAGLSFRETVQSMALISPSFSSAGDAGTSFKTFLQRLQPTTKSAKAAMADLGLYTKATGSAFYDAQGNFVGMDKATALLQASTAGLTQSQKALAFQTIFGTDAIRTAAILSEKGAAGYADMGKQLDGAGTVADQAAARQKGFNTALENAKGSVEALQLTLGAALIPALANLLNTYIAPGINAITTFASSILSAANPMQALGLAIDTVVPGFTTFASGVAAAGTFVSTNLTPVLVGLGAVLTAVVVPAIASGVAAFASAVIAGAPVVLALAAIGVAAYGLYTAWTTNVGGIQQITATVMAAVLPLFTGLEPVFGSLVGLVTNVATAFGTGGLAGAFTALQTSLPTVTAAISTWATSIGPILLGLGQQFVAWIAPMIPQAITALGGFASAVGVWIVAQAPGWAAQLLTWGSQFVAWVPTAITDVKAALPGIWTAVSTWIGDQASAITTKLGGWAGAFVAWIGPAIPGFLTAVGAFAVGIGTAIVNGVPVIVEKAKQWAKALVDWINNTAVPALTPAFNTFITTLQAQADRAKTALHEAGNRAGIALTDGLKLGWAQAPVEVSNVMKNMAADIDRNRPLIMVAMKVLGEAGIKSMVDSMSSASHVQLPSIGTLLETAILGFIPSLGIAAGKLGISIAESWYKGAYDQFQKLFPGLNALGTSMGQFLADGLNTAANLIVTAATSLGKAMMDGIAAGFGDIASWVAGKVLGGLAGAITLVRAGQRIHSPSQLWADEVGAPLGQGIAVGFVKGLGDMTPAMIKKLNEVSQAISSAASAVTAGTSAFPLLATFKAPSAESISAFTASTAAIVTALGAVAAAFKEKWLAHAGVFTDAASKGLALIGTGIDGLNKLRTFKAPSVSAVNAFTDTVTLVVQSLGTVAQIFKNQWLAKASLFEETAGKGLAIIGTGVDGLTKLKDFQAPSVSAVNAFTDTVTLTVQALGTVAQSFKDTWLQKASVFADAAAKGIGIIGGAIEAFGKLSTYSAIPKTALALFAVDLQLVMDTMIKIAQDVGIKGPAAAAVFGDAVGRTIAPIGAAVETFTKLDKYKGVARNAVLLIGNDMAGVVATMGVIAQNMDATGVAAAAAFSTSVGVVFSGIKTAIDALDSLRQYKGVAPKQIDLLQHDMLEVAGGLAFMKDQAELAAIDVLDWKTSMESIVRNIRAGAKSFGSLDGLNVTANVHLQVNETTGVNGSGGNPGAPSNPANTWGGQRAAGGPVTAGMSYLVGEHGAERFVPSTSGYILPASLTQRIAPPASAQQIANSTSYSTTYHGPTLTYAPQYVTPARPPAQEFAIMAALVGGV